MPRTARAVTISGAQAHKYQLQFAADVQRADWDCLAEDLSIHKPTPKDKVKAAITNMHTSNNCRKQSVSRINWNASWHLSSSNGMRGRRVSAVWRSIVKSWTKWCEVLNPVPTKKKVVCRTHSSEIPPHIIPMLFILVHSDCSWLNCLMIISRSPYPQSLERNGSMTAADYDSYGMSALLTLSLQILSCYWLLSLASLSLGFVANVMRKVAKKSIQIRFLFSLGYAWAFNITRTPYISFRQSEL